MPSATEGTANGVLIQLYHRRPTVQYNMWHVYLRWQRVQPMAQPMGSSYVIGGRGRNLWHNQEPGISSAATGHRLAGHHIACGMRPTYARRSGCSPRGELYCDLTYTHPPRRRLAFVAQVKQQFRG